MHLAKHIIKISSDFECKFSEQRLQGVLRKYFLAKMMTTQKCCNPKRSYSFSKSQETTLGFNYRDGIWETGLDNHGA